MGNSQQIIFVRGGRSPKNDRYLKKIQIITITIFQYRYYDKKEK